ncbi:MAG: outer membrane protein assembly factor BamA [Betaproteobacteria bacterium]
MKRARAAVLGSWLLLALPAVEARAQSQAQAGGPVPLVEQVEVTGNQFLQRETLLFYVQTKPGDPYDERKLREDFKRLWDTGFLDDLRVEALDGPKGKLVRFVVTERKRIQIVDYRGAKDLTTSTIEDELKKREAQVKIDTFYDPAKARKVESIIREMLAAKGRPFATVKHEAKTIGGSGQQLSFIIDEGPKAKVQEIVFDGNTVFSDAKLRGVMRNVKQPGFFNLSWLGGKTTYTEEKWAGGGEKDQRGDHGRLEDFYLNHGYVTVRVGQPKISYTDKPGVKNPKKAVKYMRLTIPISEGEQYRMGELKFEGLTVLKEPFVRSYFKLKPGEVYNDAKFKKAYEKLRDLYGMLGYFQWTGGTQRKPDPQRKVVDVTVKMEEDKQYFVGRINFTGNDQTRDKVIRREIYMNEGEVFNTEALKNSIKRINQLGYFKQMEGAPDIKPSELADNKVDVTFKVEEQNRNQFTFGGGVSGLEGTFLNASFSTTNFLGAGETFQVYAQTGKRTKNYSLSINEPYFLDRPITAGVDLFKRKITYLPYYNITGYTQDSTGLSLVSGFLVGKWSRAFLNYTYQVIKIGQAQIDPNDPYYQLYGYGIDTTGGAGYAAYDPLLFGDFGKRRESSITPNLVFNTVDNPWTPRKGMRHTVTMQFTGGPLGGTVNYLRPSAEAVFYLPVGRKMSLGLRGQAAWIRPFGDTQLLPYYQRYFLGGETQVRGYEIRTIGPLDSQQRPLGGNKFALFNAEYYFDVFGPLRALFFFDAGQAFLEGERMRLPDFRVSTGAELRFIMPVLNVPFRLIYAFNPNRSQYEKLYVPRSTFKFAVGTTF